MTTRYHHDPLLPPPQGGGTQRLFLEQRTRVSKVTRVLLTHLGTDTVGGLPGLVLTLTDAGTRPELKVAGPVGLRGFVRAATPFMHRQFFTTTCEECRKDATVFPHALEITAVRVTRGQAAAGSGGGGSGCNREGEGGGEGGGEVAEGRVTGLAGTEAAATSRGAVATRAAAAAETGTRALETFMAPGREMEIWE